MMWSALRVYISANSWPRIHGREITWTCHCTQTIQRAFSSFVWEYKRAPTPKSPIQGDIEASINVQLNISGKVCKIKQQWWTSPSKISSLDDPFNFSTLNSKSKRLPFAITCWPWRAPVPSNMVHHLRRCDERGEAPSPRASARHAVNSEIKSSWMRSFWALEKAQEWPPTPLGFSHFVSGAYSWTNLGWKTWL